VGEKKIIFAVDDEPAMRRVYNKILDEKFDLHCFDGAKEMLETDGGVKPDLVIIDVGLQGMDGYELCNAFKKNEGMEDVPVIFVTGRDFSEDHGQAFFSGGMDYVMKPIEEDSFLKLVTNLVH